MIRGPLPNSSVKPSISEKTDAPDLCITGLTIPNADTIRTLFGEAMRNYHRVFEARLIRLNPDGDLVDLGPDYLARIAGLRMLVHLCTRGRTPLPEPQPKRTGFTIDELMRVIAEGDPPSDQDSPKAKANPKGRLSHSSHELPSSTEPLRICELTNSHEAEIRRLFEFGLRSLGGCFEARKRTLNREGDVVDLGPDYKAGLAGMELLAQLVTLGQKPLTARQPPKQRSTSEIAAALKAQSLNDSESIGKFNDHP